MRPIDNLRDWDGHSDEPRLGNGGQHGAPIVPRVDRQWRPAESSLRRSSDDVSTAHLTATLVRLLGVLSVLLVLRYVVPSTVEEIQYRLTRGRQRAEHETAGAALRSLELHELSAAYHLVSQRVGPSVVHIETKSNDSGADARAVNRNSSDSGDKPLLGPDDSWMGEPQEQGSGVVVDADGFVVTNHHVVAHAETIVVTLSDGRRAPATIVGSDWLTDVAVLRVNADRLIAAEWGDSGQLQEGALVWAVGTPYGLKQSITAGIVSAKSLAGVAGSVYQDYLQTDAAVNPGSSGGPLVDAEGKVVGINTAILGDSYRGISFAVPSDIVQNVYQRIRSEGRFDRGWLGVELDDVSEDYARRIGLPRPMGAIVRVVGIADAGGKSPSAAAGLEVGDVIVRWDQREIDHREALVREIAQSEVGSRVEIGVVRKGRQLTLYVTLGKRPDRLN